MGTDTFTIAGVDQALLLESLSITESANGRNTMACVIVSDGSYRLPVGAEIIRTEDGIRTFGGNIDVPSEAGYGGVGGAAIGTSVTAVDFNALADGRFVSGTIPAGTLCAALQWLLPYLTPYGVTLDEDQVPGPNLPALPIDDLRLTEVLNQLSALTNGLFLWEIDYTKILRMRESSVTPAPFNIVDGDGNVDGDLTVEPSLAGYANRIILRFSAAARPAYAFLGTTANFTNGDTVVVGGTTYTFKIALTAAAGDVLIGGDEDQSLDNLANAIVLGGGSGSTYSAATVKNSSVEAFWFRASMMTAQASNVGASGNNISVTTTAANATWFTEGGVGVTTLTFGSDVSLANRVFADDLAEQAGPMGLREKRIDEPTVFDVAVARLIAASHLAQAVAIPKTVTYPTLQPGLHPGQVQTITSTLRNLSGSFLITDVVAKGLRGGGCLRTVTATGGVALLARWQDAAKQMFSGGGGSSTSGGMFIVAGGGGGSVPGLPPVPLGGSRSDYYPTAAWMPILGYRTFTCRVDGGYTFRAEACSLAAGTTVQIRLYDITAAAAVSGSTTTATASTTWVESELPVTCVAGHKYFAEMIGSNDSNGVACGQAEVER